MLAREAAAHRPGQPATTGRGGITGTVRGGRGLPLMGVCVTARGTAGSLSTITHADGRYLLPGLRPGHYTLAYRDCAEPGRYFDGWYPGTALPTGAKPVGVSPGQLTTLTPVTLLATNAAVRFPRPGTSHAAAGGGRISGTVRNRAGKRLAGICVTGLVETANFGIVFTIATGRRGHYSMPGLPPARYTIEFSAGCGNGGNYAPQWWKHASRAPKATKIHLTKGRAVTGINATLGPGAEVTGKVRLRNRFGKGLTGICVLANGIRAAAGTFAQAVTHRGGGYVLKGMASGSYRIRFEPGCGNNGNYLRASSRQPVRTRTGRVTRGINAFLQPGGGIAGTVTDSGGHPIAGICVIAETGHRIAFGETSGNGSYSLTQLTTGRYRVYFFGGCDNSGSFASQWYHNQSTGLTANPVPVAEGQTTTGIDAALAPGATISGTVTDSAGHRLSGACVFVTTPTLAQFIGSDAFLNMDVTSRGTYTLGNLDPGQYLLGFAPGCGFSRNTAGEWFKSAPSFTGATVVAAAGGAVTTGINGVLRPAGSISGTVTSKATGHRLSDICVTATSRGGGDVQSTTISFRGRYRVDGLLPGRYSVEFSPCGFRQNLTDQWFRGQDRPSGAAPVTVTAGAVRTGVSAAMRTGGSMSGLVRSAITHLPQAGVCVDAFNTVTGGGGFAATGKHGRYHMTGLDSGPYQVEFALCNQGTAALAAALLPGSVHVTAPHSVTGVNVTLHAGGGIAGTVSGGQASPKPAADICVLAIPAVGNGVGGFAITGPDGSYVARGIAPGSYLLLFTPAFCSLTETGLADTWYDGVLSESSATPVTITANKVKAGIDATMPHEGQITGTVTGPGATPLTGICVTAVPAAADAFPVLTVTSGGQYAIGDLPPGRYRVKFSSGCGAATRYHTQWYQGASSKAAATVIRVPVETTRGGIDAAMVPAG